MATTIRQDQEAALVAGGFVTAGKLKDASDETVAKLFDELIAKQDQAVDIKAEFPLGTVREFRRMDGSIRTGDLTGYNGSNAIFTIREPELIEMSLESLRKTQP